MHAYIPPTELFEQTGQYEPITTRIRNILHEYKDGIGIFKELIQNADDAGATTVKFLVDWRKGQTGSLFSPGMAKCQGPALWAYNNAVFSDEDFENINKLAGETKVEDISKIGRFGLGFNAVYHLTDVPSFISREHLVVFDPNTHHLQRHIKDKSRPGIRINLAEKPNSLTRYHDQFQLYNGIFGCNTVQRQHSFYYNGTLFRFPFRTVTQARTSDISTNDYGTGRIKEIVFSLCECASTLLIFSQHVKEVEVLELDESNQPDKMQLLLSVNKLAVEAFRRQGVNSVEPFIKQCSKWWKQYRDYQMPCTECPSGCELVTITTTKEPSDLSGCNSRHSSDQTWFVVSASGTDPSLAIARSPEGQARGFLPCGGVAFVIQRASQEGSWESAVTSDLSGELFCFLPLCIPTGLPVHVNGYFAIMSNRVEIWKRTTVRNQQIEVEWNEALMEDALARAYIMLLENMRELINMVKGYEFHSLWPNNDVVDMQSWQKLVKKLCTVLLDARSKLFYSDGKWMGITDGFLLSDDFNEIQETSVEILKLLRIHVFDLPSHILLTLKKFDSQGILRRRTLNFTDFLNRHFFPNIKILTTTQRDVIVCFGLDRILKDGPSSRKERDLFQRNMCISVSDDSRILVKPSGLIHPYGPAANLFSDEDHRFPVGNGLRNAKRLYVLETLGMVQDLNWEGILERAQSIASRNVRTSNESSRKLMKYLNDQIDDLPDSTFYRDRFQQLDILPVLGKPAGEYVLSWKGSKFSSLRLCAPNQVFLPKDANLVGSSCLVADTSENGGCGKLNEKVKDLLGFSNRIPDDKFVFHQLNEAITFWNQLSEDEKQETGKRFAIESVCKKIYEFFNSRVKKRENQSFLKKLVKQDRQFFNNGEEILEKLEKQDWLFIEGKFVQTKKVAYMSNGKGAPYLFALPDGYKRDYPHLFEVMQIKHTFDDEDYISALYDLSRTKHGSALTDDELQIATFFITQIDAQNIALVESIGDIPLPDTNSILHPSRNVAVNLDLWLKDSDDNLKVHEKIPPHTAYALGARSMKSVILKKCAHRIGYGESFGQHEDLTDRLKGILDGYPSDGILKELVQNADDAQASEIHFIHDTRPLRSEKVATDKESEEIQGPALCVFNDRPFRKEDFDGIRKLGTGSKRESLEMTGKYGIGFNSVYHLTDCPSFLSNDDTLAFLDPHSRYFVDDERGRLFNLKSVNQEFRNNISDTLEGYLPEHFDLHGSTMFRFPLRRERNESKISNKSLDVEELFQTFQKEARKSLLFLNHLKKITLSKIRSSDKLEEILRVETIITPENENKRQNLAQKTCGISATSVTEVRWEGISYILNIQENQKDVEKWLIQKCIGSDNASLDMNEIASTRELGLLPRGGLAARLWTDSKEKSLRGTVYCFLPLPENYTNLPVHVNGHFALDNHRRRLWTNTDGEGLKCKWNHFINTCVLPPAYAALIKEARNHLCNDENDNQLSRYHALFPNVLTISPWTTFTVELYRYLGRTRAKVFPLLVPAETEIAPSSILKQVPDSVCENRENLAKENPKTVDVSEPCKPVHVSCSGWLSADEAYFKKSNLKDNFLHLLIRIGVPVLLHTPYRIYCSFKAACISPNEVTEKSVISFLRGFKSKQSTSTITNLPKKLETTAVRSVPELSELLQYCCEDENFGKQLEGFPLLLTQDGYLRVFESRQPVFCSKFGELFPAQLHSFVHSEIVNEIPWKAIQSEEKIVINLTVGDLPDLLRQVFTKQVLTAIKDDVTWKYPVEGTLSEKWLERFWDFLQNYTKLEPNEDYVSLECLSEWPVIPTTHGKLVTIKDAKTVLDMTTTGNESILQKNVRTFLIKLNCPVLNKVITFNDRYSSSVTKHKATTKKTARRLKRTPAVTDAYVAHPHDPVDILVVLTHMLMLDKLNFSRIHEEEIRSFLRFVQDNYQELEEHRQLVKNLPLHKALNGQLVTLIGPYSSRAIIPSSIPTEQIDELQERIKCLFLNSDALPALEKLYRGLGVKNIEDVTKFYTEYVFKHFDVFTRESQMKHLIYIRDQVHPVLPQGYSVGKDTFLRSMRQIACISDEDGRLHKASEFFDQNNSVFKLMYEDDSEKFLPSPFNEESWSYLLSDIGLQVNMTPELFLQFCTTVAENGKRIPGDPQCHAQSEELVKCLFTEKSLLEEKLLSQLSLIEFIAPAKLEKELTSMHEQYQCSRSGYPSFIKFSNAVPWHFRNVAWTSSSILPIWAQPKYSAKLKFLDIAWSGPTYQSVLDHLQNLVKSYNPNSVDISRLHDITKSIYQFLCKSTQCSGHTPNSECTKVCLYICTKLEDVPCIFVQQDKVFVKAKQIVFKLPDKCDLKPFLYSVPQGFGDLEHLLKQLGATDRPTPKQIAYVVNSIQEKFGDEVLPNEEMKKVIYSMHMLFQSLNEGIPADEINVLYLLSQGKQLVKSCEMVCKVSSRYTDLIENLQRPILLRFEECGLKKPPDDYIDALPEHLRPKKFDELFREDVAPECKDSVCSEAERGSICKFEQRYKNLLVSGEFQEGLQRLLLQDGQDPGAYEQRLKKLQKFVQTKCIGTGSIKINIINRDTNEVMTNLEESCFAAQDEGMWTLYIQHEFSDDLVSMACCVDRILGECIHHKMGLIKMLGSSCPCDISRKLNGLGIATKTNAELILGDDDPFSRWDSDVEDKRCNRSRMRGEFEGENETRGYSASHGSIPRRSGGAEFDNNGCGIGYHGSGHHGSRYHGAGYPGAGSHGVGYHGAGYPGAGSHGAGYHGASCHGAGYRGGDRDGWYSR